MPSYDKIFHICRKLNILEDVSNEVLQDAIRTSIEKHRPALLEFDESLPRHLHRKCEATWMELTCVTIYVCNLMTGFCLDAAQSATIIRHVHMLYRVDDFMETIVELYGVHDLSAVKAMLQSSFQPYLGTSGYMMDSCDAPARIDSPTQEPTPLLINNPYQLQEDLNDVVERMHQAPICEASEKERQWYSLELYDFFLAQLDQAGGKTPTADNHGILYQWVNGVGARSIGTKYLFAAFACTISATKRAPCWISSTEFYLAQDFAQHVSVELRLFNDIGGRVRDEREGTTSSCTLLHGQSLRELEEIAEHATACSISLLKHLEQASAKLGRSEEAKEMYQLMECWRKAVRFSGELYMANDPTRVS
jgi:hypothetical protein